MLRLSDEKVEALSQAAERLRRDMVELTQKLVAIPTANPPGEEYIRAVEELEAALRRLGLKPQIIRVPGSDAYPRFCLLASWGAGERLLQFHGHYDVVPAAHPSHYAPRLEGGYLYGRGASDMKGGLAAMLFALRALEEAGVPLDGRILISLVPDEETGGRLGTNYLWEQGYLQSGVVGMLMPEPTSGVIWNANRGALSMKVTVHGRPAHVGLECRGVNAFLGMLKAASALAELRERVGQRLTKFDVDPPEARRSILLLGGTCGGGVNFNLVPPECFFTLDRRPNPEENLEEAKAEVLAVLEEQRRQGIDLDWEVLQEGQPARTSTESELAQALAAAIERATGAPARFEMCPGLTELRFFVPRGVPALVYGPGLVEVSHGPGEYLVVDDLRRVCLVYSLVAAELLAPTAG